MKIEELADILVSLVRIPSFSREEGAAADALDAALRAKGFDLHRSGNNVWMESEARSDKPTLMLNAHIDTVKPVPGWTCDPFGAERDGDIIRGLGTNDDGGSIVALLGAYCELSSRPQPYRLVYSVTAEEEVCGAGGIQTIMDEVGPVALAIVGEPTGMRLAVAERGLLVLDCKSAGVSGHAAREEGVNAIYNALPDIDWFRNYRFDKVSEYLGPVKMSVTMIQAGTQHNVVPDSCSFVVDVRPNGMYTNRQIVDEICSHVSCEVKPRSMKHNSSHIEASHPVVRRAVGMGMETFGSPTTSNQTVLECTSVKIGPGDSSRSHTADEYIRISEINDAVGIYVELLDGLQL